MKFIDILQLSTRIFRTNKMRTALTILGIGVGIGAILFLVSLGYGLQKIILEKIASSDSLLALDVVAGATDEFKLNQSLIDKISQKDLVADVSPLVGYSSLVDVSDYNGGAEVKFIKNSFFGLSGMKLASGAFFNDSASNEIVISTAILKLFNIDKNAINQGVDNVSIFLVIPKNNKKESVIASDEDKGVVNGEVEIREFSQKFKIVGVVENDNAPYMYLNIANIKDFDVAEFDQIKIKAKSRKDVEQLRSEIFEMGYGVSSIGETIDQANKIFSIIQMVLAAFGIVALVVSAIGMFNTMTISLLQRTREIGIMKAIGAKNRDVKKLFLMEAFLIGTLGGLVGLLIGFILQNIFNFLLSMLAKTFGGAAMNMFYTPNWFIILIIIFSSVVGILTGIWPAIRASKLNPLEALRYK